MDPLQECPHCGKKTPEENLRCIYCGERLPVGGGTMGGLRFGRGRGIFLAVLAVLVGLFLARWLWNLLR